MHESAIKNISLKEMKELEKQINDLILGYKEHWKQRFHEIKVIPISEIKNNLPYDLQKGGRIQLYLTGDF